MPFNTSLEFDRTCKAGMIKSPWNIASARFIRVSQNAVAPSHAKITMYVKGDPCIGSQQHRRDIVKFLY